MWRSGNRKKAESFTLILLQVERFVNEHCIPSDAVYAAQLGKGEQRWMYPPIMEDLKMQAKSLGLWNMFLAKHHYRQGAGFTNLEYGLMCEQFGRSRTASEATNNAAPDTGNMELLAKYGSDMQKSRWLEPLLKQDIRSCYVMTEPDTASSDATNVQLSMKRDGDFYVLNGQVSGTRLRSPQGCCSGLTIASNNEQKWWISGAGDPRCKVYIVLGKTDPNYADKYKQQSIIIVPSDSPGIEIKRMLSVYGYDDAPHGHAHLVFKNVRVPKENIVLGEGKGFEVMQGRMGPGRIHHAMRSIGAVGGPNIGLILVLMLCRLKKLFVGFLHARTQSTRSRSASCFLNKVSFYNGSPSLALKSMPRDLLCSMLRRPLTLEMPNRRSSKLRKQRFWCPTWRLT